MKLKSDRGIAGNEHLAVSTRGDSGIELLPPRRPVRQKHVSRRMLTPDRWLLKSADYLYRLRRADSV